MPETTTFLLVTLRNIHPFIVNCVFFDINILQDWVATYARSGGIINNLFTANLPRNLPIFFS